MKYPCGCLGFYIKSQNSAFYTKVKHITDKGYILKYCTKLPEPVIGNEHSGKDNHTRASSNR